MSPSPFPAADLRKFSAQRRDGSVGTIHQDSVVPAYILTDELFGKHFSIVGLRGRVNPALSPRS
jgi:hypothetical protein